MKQKKIFIPTKNFECWKELLANKERQWKPGFSSMSTAKSWEGNKDIPSEIRNVISQNADFSDMELLLAIPEYKVDLDGGARPSQSDVLAVLTTEKSLTVMVIEGKATEGFGKSIRDWKKKTSERV